MSLVNDIFNRLHHRFFDSVTRNRLIYNTCWEDPRIDRQLLNLSSKSNVVMLTSAGCNALDYLLDEPASIHCVDTNPAQNALLELKQSLFIHGNYELLWRMFGEGQYRAANTMYHHYFRQLLSGQAQNFWDHHIDYFLPSGAASSFYFHGTSGSIANIFYKRIKHKGLYGDVLHLLNANSLDEQRYYFEEIEPHLWNAFSRWLLQRDTTMALLGVPRGQRAIIDDEVSGGLPSFIHQSIRNVFTERPLHDNYFWRVYLTGSYTKVCCPNYLKEQHFQSIRKNIGKISHTTGSLTNFLKRNPGSYSHFVLLDHQDWLASNQPEKLAEEWRLILDNAAPGAKVLFRSAGQTRSFLPSFADRQLTFEDTQTAKLHNRDRVGTYGSTHLAFVNQV